MEIVELIPPKSISDIESMDYYFWDYLKSIVYGTPVEILVLKYFQENWIMLQKNPDDT